MTTKKQRRAAVAAKREKFDEAMRISGLAAQRKDQKHRLTEMENASLDAERRQNERVQRSLADSHISNP